MLKKIFPDSIKILGWIIVLIAYPALSQEKLTDSSLRGADFLFFIQDGTAQLFSTPKLEPAIRQRPNFETEIMNRFVQEKRSFRTFMKGTEGTSITFTGEKKMIAEDTEAYAISDNLMASGTLASNYDLNPHRRFHSLDKNIVQEVKLLKILKAQLSVSSHPASKIFKRILTTMLKNHRTPDFVELKLDVIRDDSKDKNYAVLSAYQMSQDGTQAATLLAVLVSHPTETWQVWLLESDQGCASCDAQINRYELVNWGDLFKDGHLDLVVNFAAYESWGYKVYQLEPSPSQRILAIER